MIEKVIRAVKSSNKKRGRNITIGAVVGMLLSCTTVMGADDYLWIKNDSEIEFSKDSADKDGTDGTWGGNPYTGDNSWEENIYVNNITLYGTDNGENKNGNTIGYGLRLNGNLKEVSFINNGSISGTSNSSSSYGIYVESYASSNSIGNITNNGSMSGLSTGLHIYSSNNAILTIGNITNSGVISGGNGSDKAGIWIYNLQSNTTVGSITNSGIISSEGSSGIYNKKEGKCTTSIESIVNSGVIYGTIAIHNSSVTIGQSYNYGILVAGSDTLVLGVTIDNNNSGDNKIKNYGLTIKNTDTTAEVTAVSDSTNVDVIIGYDDNGNALKRKMNIKNKSGNTGTDSFSGNDNNNSILNALENTYKVNGNYTVTGSIINAYGTAVKFDENGNKSLTLSGTIVNGGLDGSKVIAGGAGADTLTLTNGTIINGAIDGGGDTDTLNFRETITAKVVAASSSADEIRILHDISGFENINVNSNVTFYETGVAVTGVNNLTIGKNGVLTLRIDTSTGTATHALVGNTGTIKSVDGGKLLLALNGAGKTNKISFGNLNLDGSLKTGYESEYQKDVTFETTSELHSVKRTGETNKIEITARVDLPYSSVPDNLRYEKLNEIYQSLIDQVGNFNVDDDEKLSTFLGYLNDIYAGNPYSYSSELSRKSAGMFRDIVTENIFKPETNKWMIYGGLTHVDGGTKDTYYGKGYYTYDIGSSDMDADTKITGAYMLGEYGVSDTLTSGVVIGGNKLKSDLSNGSKVDGSAMYLGAYAKKYIGNLKVTAGAGLQYGDYDADRLAVNRVASDSAESVMKYSDNYNDISYDIYLNGRYSHNIGDNLFLEPYATLSYTYIDQDGANEGSKALAIETDSKSFDYTVGKVGVDLKKVIPHEKGKSTLTAGVSYTKILDGAEEEYITGRFKGGSDFNILVAHKNEHSIGLNAKYALELENGVLFDVKGTYSIERDSHNQSGKNRTKGEWIVGAGIGYKF